MKLRRNALATILVSLVAVVALTTILTNRLFVRTTEQTEGSQFTLMRSIIQFNLQGAENNALARAELVASLPRVRELFASGNRDGLYAEMKQMFEVQKDKFSIDQSQVHVAPATSFLRLNDPTRFGDDLSSFRPIVVAVNGDKVARKGLSISRSGPGIFGVVPVTHNGKFVGTFEFGSDFGGVLDRVKSAYALESALLIDEARLKQAAPNLGGDVFTEKNRVGKYIKYQSTNWELMKNLVTDAELGTPGIENQPYMREAQDTPYGVVMVPLTNPAGDKLGYIVTASDFSPSRSAMGQSMIWLGMFSLFAVVVLAGVIIVTFQGAIARPLAVLNARFAELAETGRAEAIDHSEGFFGEIRELAQHYERMRFVQDAPSGKALPLRVENAEAK
jgi:methyl-accepting chemotaxis protein